MQYILAKLTQYVDEEAYGSIGTHTDLSNYINPKVTIEHILPQKFNKLKTSFDKPEEIENYIQRLGNLTLLEESINKSIKHQPFEYKINAYKSSKFLITKSIAEPIKIGINTAVDRAVKELKDFDVWDSKSIEYRQEILTKLAKKVWNII
ncbi:MAG: HNH endonuclease family protein [Aulosira sp. ZfuVER01]|nr:HNH endonuclease family protein [Aulosira sp. ZfuVER01]MDZ7998171.1 HNH endonuclease family protein [Aulosira sp. DedVER01a]MDZ8052827.1 HNH endonuclease family protein [Aulosira sp. ZfuCHP01]